MSMKKKAPGKRWITGIQRAQLRRLKLLNRSVLTANNKLPLLQQPMVAGDKTIFDNFDTVVAGLLLLKS